jgi:hypothetical protein
MKTHAFADTLTKPKVDIETSILTELKPKEDEESQVVLHCEIPIPFHFGMLIRIFSSTYLYDAHSSHKSKLVHFENIALGPAWKQVPPGGPIQFTLFFTGLPKSCNLFHFKEEISDNTGFKFRNIVRNQSDVYTIKLNPF